MIVEKKNGVTTYKCGKKHAEQVPEMEKRVKKIKEAESTAVPEEVENNG